MTSAVVAVHGVAALATIAGLLFAAAWGVLDFRQCGRLSRRYDRVLWGVQAVLTLQVIAGVTTLLLGRWPHEGRHLVYGSVASLLPWAVWLLVRRQRRISLHMAITCVVATGFGVAAVFTA